MIQYVTVGTNDFLAAENFFNSVLSELGVIQAHKTDRMIFWASAAGGSGFSVVKPLDGEPATVGNGVMVSFQASNKDQVDSCHAQALSLGGSDEGGPGVRNNGYYVAYFRDLDGNKFNIFCEKP